MLTTEEKGIRVTFSSYLTENTAFFDQKDRQQQYGCIYYIVRLIWNTHNLFVEIVLDFKRGGKYINQWDVKGVANFDVAKGLIFFMFICFRPYLFSVLVKFGRPCWASPPGAVSENWQKDDRTRRHR